ncbi:MAG TPA: helix-turn-helix domain-containing protein [Methylobacter sp.]
MSRIIMTTHIEFTSETLGILKKERYAHPVPLVRRRLQALWLKSRGLSNRKIALLVGICETTLRDYFQLYQQSGVEGLKNLYFCFG